MSVSDTKKEDKPFGNYSNSSSVYPDVSVPKPGQKVDVLRDDDPITGQKWCVLSMVSPESRQKNKVYGLKIRFVSETVEEAERMAEFFRDRDPTFDCFVGSVGKWLPWIWNADEIKNVKFTNSQLTELIADQYKQKELSDSAFDDRVQRELEAIKQDNTKEGIERRLNQKEKCVSVYFKIIQLEQLIKTRQEELDAVRKIFESDDYTDYERKQSVDHMYPKVNIAPSQFQHIHDGEGDCKGDGDDVSAGVTVVGASDVTQVVDTTSNQDDESEEAGDLGESKPKHKGLRRLFKR